jgi:hypothetical protein
MHASGLVIGRAIAHEIGHHLLGPGHSSSGLMRASFSAREFVEGREGSFELSDRDAWALSGRLTHGLAKALAASSSPLVTSD